MQGNYTLGGVAPVDKIKQQYPNLIDDAVLACYLKERRYSYKKAVKLFYTKDLYNRKTSRMTYTEKIYHE